MIRIIAIVCSKSCTPIAGAGQRLRADKVRRAAQTPRAKPCVYFNKTARSLAAN
jgi:hypothetical protein